MSDFSNATQQHRQCRQGGFSLVELMVSVALGSLIVVAAVQLLQTNQRTFELQQAVSDVQESGRFAVEYIGRDMRRVGLAHPDTSMPQPAGVVIGANASQDDSQLAGMNDQLMFEFYGYVDCEGDQAAGAVDTDPNTWVLISNFYDVRVNADGDSELFCRGSVDPNTDGAALIQGVDSFQLLYGVDRSIDGDSREDGIGFAGRYLPANLIQPSDYIVSVRVGVLIRTEQDNLPELGDGVDFIVLDKNLPAGQPPLDVQRVRRLFVSTIKIRNFDWQKI